MSSNQRVNDSNDSNSMFNCPFCGQENPADFHFCLTCGKNISTIICFNCYTRVLSSAKVCPNCRADLKKGADLNLTMQTSTTQYSLVPQSMFESPFVLNYPTNYPSTFGPEFDYYNKQQEPKWWNLPIFFIIYCMFGLLILSAMITAFLSGIFGLNHIGTPEYILIDIMTKVVQFLLILFALKFFKGLRSFLAARESNQSVNSEYDILPSKNSNTLIRLFFLLFFISFLLAIDLYTNGLISYIKNFFNLPATNSTFGSLDGSMSNYFILVFFWVVIFAPIHEEILFRGILQQALNRSGTSDFSHYIIQGTTFAFMHLAGDVLDGGSIEFIMIHMISTFMFAIAATYLRKKFNSLILPILLHSGSNAITMGFNYFLSTDYFTSTQLRLIENAIYIIPLLCVIFIPLLLYIFSAWKPDKPMSLKGTKSLEFIYLILLLAFILNTVQYTVLLIQSAEIEFVYGLALTVFSLQLFIKWGRRINDLTWAEIEDLKKT